MKGKRAMPGRKEKMLATLTGIGLVCGCCSTRPREESKCHVGVVQPCRLVTDDDDYPVTVTMTMTIVMILMIMRVLLLSVKTMIDPSGCAVRPVTRWV
jgi:hypothetical protein